MFFQNGGNFNRIFKNQKLWTTFSSRRGCLEYNVISVSRSLCLWVRVKKLQFVFYLRRNNSKTWDWHIQTYCTRWGARQTPKILYLKCFFIVVTKTVFGKLSEKIFYWLKSENLRVKSSQKNIFMVYISSL
jgi:hypothetical protein